MLRNLLIVVVVCCSIALVTFNANRPLVRTGTQMEDVLSSVHYILENTSSSFANTDVNNLTAPSTPDPSRCRHHAAIVLFGRVRERDTKDRSSKLLKRVRREVERHVIGPNEKQFQFTIVVRVEDPQQDALLVEDAFSGSPQRVVLVTEPFNLTIQEPSLFGCGYRMWSNIQVAVRALGAIATGVMRNTTTTQSGCPMPMHPEYPEELFKWVLVLRTEILINTPFELSLLNPRLFYIANFCGARQRYKHRVYEYITRKVIPCLENETMPISAVRWPQYDHVANNKARTNHTRRHCNHTLSCRLLLPLGKKESASLTMPDYYFLANATTMREMFYSIVNDWFRNLFRKSDGHCNHGLLGGRLVHKTGLVPIGRYKYHKIDVEIPRVASWYPRPSLHEYLWNRGVLWESPHYRANYRYAPDYDTAQGNLLVRKETVFSRCHKTVCSIDSSEVFQG